MLDAFAAMRAADHRVNEEFYVGPSYNFLQGRDKPVAATNLGPVSTVMYGLGTPEDYELFIASDVSTRAVTDAVKRGIPA